MLSCYVCALAAPSRHNCRMTPHDSRQSSAACWSLRPLPQCGRHILLKLSHNSLKLHGWSYHLERSKDSSLVPRARPGSRPGIFHFCIIYPSLLSAGPGPGPRARDISSYFITYPSLLSAKPYYLRIFLCVCVYFLFYMVLTIMLLCDYYFNYFIIHFNIFM